MQTGVTSISVRIARFHCTQGLLHGPALSKGEEASGPATDRPGYCRGTRGGGLSHRRAVRTSRKGYFSGAACGAGSGGMVIVPPVRGQGFDRLTVSPVV